MRPLSAWHIFYSTSAAASAFRDGKFLREGLGHKDPQVGELVKMRYFIGLAIQESADAIGLKKRTAEGIWQYGRVWLRRRLRESPKSREKKLNYLCGYFPESRMRRCQMLRIRPIRMRVLSSTHTNFMKKNVILDFVWLGVAVAAFVGGRTVEKSAFDTSDSTFENGTRSNPTKSGGDLPGSRSAQGGRSTGSLSGATVAQFQDESDAATAYILQVDAELRASADGEEGGQNDRWRGFAVDRQMEAIVKARMQRGMKQVTTWAENLPDGSIKFAAFIFPPPENVLVFRSDEKSQIRALGLDRQSLRFS